MRSLLSTILVVGLAAGLAACGGTNNTSTTTPTSPSTTQVTDTYSGNLTTGGSVTHTFTVGVGVVTTTLTNLAPLSTASIGVILGTWDGTTCTAILQNDNMKVGGTLVGTAQGTVNLCLRVYDVGNIPADTTYTYTATVAHY